MSRRYKSTGVEAEQGRKRREDNLIQIRKNKRRHTLLNKRNHPLPLLHHHHIHDSAAAPFPLSNTLEGHNHNIPALLQRIWSNDPAAQLEATAQFRKLLLLTLSVDSPQIDEVIEERLVSRFVEFLTNHDLPNLQNEAAWALSNITWGKSEHKRVVIKQGAVPVLVNLLHSSTIDVKEKVLCCLGNIALSNRDVVLDHGALLPILSLLEHFRILPLYLLRTATWALSNLCSGNPPPPFQQVKPALPVLGQLIHLHDEGIMSNACWALSYLSDGTIEKIQALIEEGLCPKLIHLLNSHPSPLVIEPALRTLGNIVSGNDVQTQLVIDNQILPSLQRFLTQDHKKSIKREACWTISNITAGNEDQIQAVLDANIIPALVDLIHYGEFDIKMEAAWAINNAIVGGSHWQIRFLTSQGCIEALCDLLTCPDPNVVNVCLEGLGRILKVGKVDKELGLHGGVNVYAQMVEDCKGLENIENLETHRNIEIYGLAVKILGIYFVDDLQEDPPDGGDDFS
ncbi:Importin-alpha, importin-beta-binding domain [Sesbania bispinosa]|nr:Importin-alpha, importin-beta-binding domain [Sesbania bispinosa]